MYTRPFNIPKNYNGVRFNNAKDDIPVKEHRPSYENGVKTSHSPLFKQENKDTPSDVIEISSSETDAQEESVKETLSEETKDILPQNDSNNELYLEASEQKHFNLPIRELLNSINTEDALLICLILLIAAEKVRDNNSVLTMLSLLLLKR